MRKTPGVAPSPSAGPSLRLRQYMYFTAATTGMVIMIVEILGAKMLAPYVGTSHFVWTAQIAVTLVALSAGYYAGGWLADRTQKLNWLYAAILVAAVYLCVTVPLVRPIAFWCLDFRLALGSLLASAILFFVPLALLAMVGPFFVRTITSAVTDVGHNVGRLTSIGTLGSFFGTILIGYVLIPYLPNSVTMLVSAGLLMCVTAGYFILWNRKAAPIFLVLLAGSAATVIGVMATADECHSPVPDSTLVFRGNSNFGQLAVVDMTNFNGGRRYYLNDLLIQNIYDTSARQSTAMFTYMLHGLAVAYTPKIEDALCIGMGVGIVPREFLRDHANVDVVEINPAVIPVAREYFDCPVDQLHITVGDGRQFLNRCARKYDAVALDAFLGDSCPSHLMTKEAFTSMQHVLRSNGVLVINTFGDLGPKRDFLASSVYKTLKSVFARVRIHYAGRNMLFVASDQPELKILNPPDYSQIYPACHDDVESTFSETPEPDPHSGMVLTDDYNPVEFYDAANREENRRILVSRIMKR
ncbi:MAG TPA: fused MFS/spermidine synthase [Verrucomicrobiae bacterium]|nr:fused MFS/spermidine synthase [Verrucomicrobiae bacterium]